MSSSLFSRRKVAALVAEFLGTSALAFVVLTVSRSQIGIPYFVAFAAGLVVILFGAALSRDVMLNPALTIGLWTGRRIRTIKAILYIAVQLLGGLAAYSLYKYFSRSPVQPLPTAFDAHIMIAEALGTFVFSFIVAGVGSRMLADVSRNAIAGLGLSLGIVVASSASAAFINPAVALAANSWAWSTYVAGPVLGAILGVNLNGLLFADRREKAVASASTAKIVTTNIVEDSKAVKSGRLAKVEKAEKAVASRASKSSRKKK